MADLRKREQAAIEAVAKHFSATLEPARAGERDAYLAIKGKRVAVAVVAIKGKIVERGGAAKPRLRFDKVVLRLFGFLRAALREIVPDGQTIIVTVTAPIRLPGKTASALEDAIRGRLARKSAKVEIEDTIHANQVRVRLVKGVPRGTSKVIGFVHNPDTNPDILLRLTQSLLEHVGAAAGKRAARNVTGDRWLVVASEDGASQIETYRHVYSQLGMPTGFRKVLLVLSGGRVDSLAG